MVGRLEKKRAELPQNKKHNELKQLLFQPLNIVQHGYTSSEETGASEVEIAAHENDKAKAEKLTSNLSRLGAHSIDKHIKCWDKKIAEVQSHIKRLKSDMKSQTKTINKLESKLKWLIVPCILSVRSYIVQMKLQVMPVRSQMPGWIHSNVSFLYNNSELFESV